jgi:hypothetical protein
MSDEEAEGEGGRFDDVNIDWRRGGKIFLTTVGITGAIALWVFISQQFGLLNTAVVTVALAVGGGLLPAVWYILGKDLPKGARGVVARITWTIAGLIHGPYVVWYGEDGRVELLPADPDNNRVRVDGEWRRLDPDGNWSRLGKTQFGVSYEKTRDSFEGAAVARDDSSDFTAGRAVTGERAGQLVGTRYRSTARNLVVDISRVCSRFRGAAGGAVADAAKMDGLRDHGGGGEFGAKWIVLGILGSLFLGAISGWVMFA